MPDAPVSKRPVLFSTDRQDAGEALKSAHELAFAPYAFQAAMALRQKGILQLLIDRNQEGAGFGDLATASGLSENSAHVLIEAGLAIGLLIVSGNVFTLTKKGYFFASNDTIRINASFMQDVCVPGAKQLSRSLSENQPAGLAAFGSWGSIFEGLDQLPTEAHDSWYAFNNHHSEAAFRDALPQLFTRHPVRILDVGGSTGRFALACLDWSDSVHVGVADICADEALTEPGVKSAVRAGRITLHPMDVLHAAADLPFGYDTIWMSQFLPCFSQEQVMEIFAKCHKVLPEEGSIFLMETFWDLQRQQAVASALQLTSLYFVNIATGVSRMWSVEDVSRMITAAGFQIVDRKENIGRGHTLMEIRKA